MKSRADDGVPAGSQVVLVDNSDVQNTSAVGSWPASDVAAGFQGFDYQTHDAGTGTNSFTYGYDPNGNLVDIGDSSPGAAVDDYAVTYTGLDQVSKVEEKLAGVVKHTTAYTYDPNSAPLTRTHDTAVDTYVYGVRNLLASVTNAASASDPSPKVTSFVYNARAQVSAEVKGNANTVDYGYFLNKALQHQVEKKPDGTVVAEHTYDYDPDGNRITDVSHIQNADNHAAYIDRTGTSTYDPRDRLASVTKTDGGSTVESESYVHDANNNVTTQTVGGVTTGFTFDRNRLLTGVTGGATAGYNYDPFGRLDTVTSGGQVIERHTYDGFDRIAKETKQVTGGGTATTTYTTTRWTGPARRPPVRVRRRRRPPTSPTWA